jgi:hypothetical protein
MHLFCLSNVFVTTRSRPQHHLCDYHLSSDVSCRDTISVSLFCNLAKWWLNHRSSALNIRKLAVRILCLTCSSLACERCWSSFEQV